MKRSDKVTSLILASPGYRQEAPDVLAALASVRQDLLCNKIGNGGDDTGTFPDVPLDDIVAYFIGSLDRLADARAEMRVRFQSRCTLISRGVVDQDKIADAGDFART